MPPHDPFNLLRALVSDGSDDFFFPSCTPQRRPNNLWPCTSKWCSIVTSAQPEWQVPVEERLHIEAIRLLVENCKFRKALNEVSFPCMPLYVLRTFSSFCSEFFFLFRILSVFLRRVREIWKSLLKMAVCAWYAWNHAGEAAATRRHLSEIGTRIAPGVQHLVSRSSRTLLRCFLNASYIVIVMKYSGFRSVLFRQIWLD